MPANTLLFQFDCIAFSHSRCDEKFGRRGREVEGTPLLREHLAKNWIEGSNPSVSARRFSRDILNCPGISPGSPPQVASGEGVPDLPAQYPSIACKSMGTRKADVTTNSRSIHRLSALSVARLKKSGYYCDGGGLYLQVSLAGARSWAYRFRHEGRLREMGLGGLLRVSLADARECAQGCRRQLDNGLDPIEERRRERARRPSMNAPQHASGPTARAGKTEKHVAQWESTLATYASPLIGRGSRCATSTRHDAHRERAGAHLGRRSPKLRVACASRCWTGRRHTGIAREDENPNPARWKGHLDKVLPVRTKVRKVRHHAALPYAEVAAFMKTLRVQEGLCSASTGACGSHCGPDQRGDRGKAG